MTTSGANVNFAETADQALLRDAVAKIATDFGHEYFSRKARSDEHTTELWHAVARAGYVGVNVPRSYGGGGKGITELSIVAEELAAHGCPLMLLLVSQPSARQSCRGSVPTLSAGGGFLA
jgi:alkylation response protein AidB-like acyl-CoA dehydrogenase